MTIIRSSIGKKKKDENAKYRKRYRISSDYYATDYTNSLFVAYIHYYGHRLASLGGGAQILDTWEREK